MAGDDDFAEKALASELDVGQKISLNECVEHVCSSLGLKPSALSERSRVRRHSEARAIVAWLMRKFDRESLTAIASYFNRDVATMSEYCGEEVGREAAKR